MLKGLLKQALISGYSEFSNRQIVLQLSGGCDSTALLIAMNELKKNHPFSAITYAFQQPPSFFKRINLLEKLFEINGSYLMYYRDEKNTVNKGTIHLKRKIKATGKIVTGRIEYEGIGKEYKSRYISGNNDKDIFSFMDDDLAHQLLDNKFHSTQEWLEATYHLDYPMHPDLISRHFKNPRSADIILSNDETIKFGIHHGKQKSKNLYDHDLGLRQCMAVPLIIGGSLEIPRKKVSFSKITDIVPTLLKLIGRNPHKSVLGSSLI